MARPHRESVQVHIRAEPRAVWNLIADVTRMGEWSPVCRRCAWIAPATGPAAGARFVGHNRMAGLRWSRECEVVVCEPGTEFAF
ncbi:MULTISPECIES: SRPBCC family protein, partial [unclassified Nonomuraea]|uniref:SRPBCC family protein n=1 Tax=unclassified Nonomuraea TaxID=2593643 RepID=UPI0013776308